MSALATLLIAALSKDHTDAVDVLPELLPAL